MNWARLGWTIRAGAALTVALAIMTMAGATPSAAAPYTLNFTGTAAEVDGFFSAAGIVPGDAVSGSITYDPLGSTTSVDEPWPNSITLFPQAAGSFTFHVSHPGALDYTQSHASGGQVQGLGSASGDRLSMEVADDVAGLSLFFATDAANPALTSLAGLPTDANGILALLAGGNLRANGTFRLVGYGNIGFNIAFAPTPVPAALPLFASALGGLGIAAWRRRRATASLPKPVARLLPSRRMGSGSFVRRA
jgi:hypothetical protein